MVIFNLERPFAVAITKTTTIIVPAEPTRRMVLYYDSNYELTASTVVHYSLPSRSD